jgi:3-oxoacyl-[acyl-carrier protein] reductase
VKRLENKVAVVTGGSKGIGAGIAKAFGAEGAAVVVNFSKDKAGADRVVDEITSQGGKAISVQGDVSKQSDAKRIIAEAKKTFGRLDVLVNNAGVYTFVPFEKFSEDEFHRQFNTNVLGTFLLIREAIDHFGPEGGSIINIGSTASSTTPPTLSIYVAAKSAVDGITRVLAKELGPRKIRINSVNPGATNTEGAHASGVMGTDFERDLVAKTPLGRLGQPEDIARVAVFLASADSGWLTGEVLHASGGHK